MLQIASSKASVADIWRKATDVSTRIGAAVAALRPPQWQPTGNRVGV